MKAALCLGITLAATGIAPAQAAVTAQRGAEIAPFFMTTQLHPDFGQPNNVGFSAGVDYTRFIQSIIQPSIELRYTNANGQQVGEHTFTGGLKLQTTIHRLHPYATLLGGTAGITFAHPVGAGYKSDNCFVYAFGGGVDLNLLQSWKVRADFSQQHWDLDPTILTPMTLSIGIAYSIPFHGGGWSH
jgi:opacity protein-like surface antigen